jgi:hypothetical protein
LQQWEPAGSKSTWESLVDDIVARDEAVIVEHLSELMVWLQDLNWPGARRMADFLARLGPPVLPHVRAVLQGTDREWQYWILAMLVDRWPRDLVAELQTELMALAHADTRAEVDVMALAQLMKHQMSDPSEVRRLIDHKRAVYQSTPHLLEWLEDAHPSV